MTSSETSVACGGTGVLWVLVWTVTPGLATSGFDRVAARWLHDLIVPLVGS